MPRTKKPHRGRNAWRKDILRLTCLLRLRISPPLPYDAIADLLLRTKARVIAHLVRITGPDSLSPDDKVVANFRPGTRAWLIVYLRAIYETAVDERSVHLARVRDLEEVSVRGKIEALCGALMGDFESVVGEEARLQSRWRSEGDWRLGSVPDDGGKRGCKEHYTPERVRFFEDMVGGIVGDDKYMLEQDRCHVFNIGHKLNASHYKSDTEQVSSSEDGDNLAGECRHLLTQLEVVSKAIQDLRLWIRQLDNSNITAPDESQDSLIAAQQNECGNTNSDAEEQYQLPQLVVPDKELPLVNKQIFKSKENTGLSPMILAAEKAFKEWQDHTRTQAWLVMSK